MTTIITMVVVVMTKLKIVNMIIMRIISVR